MAPDLAWFFGYGSLMWNPGFAHEAFEPARLEGWRRGLCIYSQHYRGTPARRGLVLGLQPGGRCTGRAFGVAPPREPEVLAYLDARELLGAEVYVRRRLTVALLPDGPDVEAWCYVARPECADYAGDLDRTAVLRHVRQGHGLAGSCADYLRNTVAHLRAMAIAEPGLEGLLAELDEAEEAALTSPGFPARP